MGLPGPSKRRRAIVLRSGSRRHRLMIERSHVRSQLDPQGIPNLRLRIGIPFRIGKAFRPYSFELVVEFLRIGASFALRSAWHVLWGARAILNRNQRMSASPQKRLGEF